MSENGGEKRKGIVERASEFLGCNPDRLFDLLREKWECEQPFTNEELFPAVSMIARYGLDPLMNEIRCTRERSGRVISVILIDGWVKILNRTPGYDGHEQTIEWDEDHNPRSCTTTIHSKNRSHPVSYTAYWSEYSIIGGELKESIPIHMLRMFSLRQAARQFAPIGGDVVSEGEVGFMQRQDPEVPPVDEGAVQKATLMATLNHKVGCSDDVQRGAVCEWAVGREVDIESMDGEVAKEVHERIMDWAHLNNDDWDAILDLAMPEENH